MHNICLFDSQIQILYIFSLIESAVGTPLPGWAAAMLEDGKAAPPD